MVLPQVCTDSTMAPDLFRGQRQHLLHHFHDPLEACIWYRRASYTSNIGHVLNNGQDLVSHV